MYEEQGDNPKGSSVFLTVTHPAPGGRGGREIKMNKYRTFEGKFCPNGSAQHPGEFGLAAAQKLHSIQKGGQKVCEWSVSAREKQLVSAHAKHPTYTCPREGRGGGHDHHQRLGGSSATLLLNKVISSRCIMGTSRMTSVKSSCRRGKITTFKAGRSA